MTLNEVLDLSELGAACAADGIYEFLFTAAPLHVVGGTGGPVNPVVLKASGQARGEKGEDQGDDDSTEDNPGRGRGRENGRRRNAED